MKLHHKLKIDDGYKLLIETAIELDDGTFHSKTGFLEIVSSPSKIGLAKMLGIDILEFNILKEWFGKEAKNIHLIVNL